MTVDRDTLYKRALGARILGEANDLKRTRQALSAELGMAQSLVDSVIDGNADLQQAEDLMRAMADTYPIALSDLWLEPDDTDEGVVITRAATSLSTARIFDRKDRDGALTPYYEYRDTAMTRLGPFKPEWIQELRYVDDADPDNPDVAYNNGHLMHQQTFFIGEVNFYWSSGGKNHCAEMNTGDSNYITPFVPHSFASRNREKPGLIVAVTFGGEIRRALDDFSRIDAATAEKLSGDLRTPEAAYQARLNRYLAIDSLSPGGLAEQLRESGLNDARADQLAEGAMPVSLEETEIVAKVLSVRPKDLLISGLDADEEVVIRYAHSGGGRPWPNSNSADYRLTPLARTKHMPALKGFAVEVLGDSSDAATFQHHLFEYAYNYGDAPILIQWTKDREETLEPGDSICFRPMIEHRFVRPENAGEGRLCIVRVPGALNDPAMDEYARFAPSGRGRVSGETKQWF